MKERLPLRLLIRLFGAIAVAALIWLAAPFIKIGGDRPFEAASARSAAILIAVALIAGAEFLHPYRRRKRAARLMREIGASADDPRAEAAQMKKALAALDKVEGGRTHYLLDRPWLILFGARGAGKTMALARSGLASPLATGGAPGPIGGVGAARFCDWWFSGDAVVIDASGLAAGLEATDRPDPTSWSSLLDLVKRGRPNAPIDAVLVAISVEDLLMRKPAETAAQADAIRASLLALRRRLGVDVPVYVLFTKADVVLGFSEFFANLDEAGRAQAWGALLEPTNPAKSALAQAGAAFDALIARLDKGVAGRLAEEPDPARRALLFGFPTQMESLRGHAIDALNRIFDPGQGKFSAPLRGFFFTSATQQDAPIDLLQDMMARAFRAEPVARPANSGPGKGFFLEDVFQTATMDGDGVAAAPRSGRIGARVGYAILLAVASLALGALWMNYAKNNARIARSAEAAAKYRALAAGLGETESVSDHDLVKILPALHALRFLPDGFSTNAAAVPAGFGLNQAARLQSAAEAAYGAGLERLLRPRLLVRLEEQLAADAENPTALFETLEAYLMLGGREPVNRRSLLAFLERDWSKNLYPGTKNAEGRKALELHVAAMLDLAAGDGGAIPLNGRLIEKAQAALARVNFAERAYRLLAARAKESLGDDWFAGKSAGPEALQVFEKSIETIRAPYFHTRRGFERAFLAGLPALDVEMERLRRVLGAAGREPAVLAQFDRWRPELVDLYVKGFLDSWRDAIDKLKFRRLIADRPAYPLLAAAAAANSPIERILASIREETLLPETKEEAEAPEAALIVGTSGETPARKIDAALQPYHQLVEGEAGARPIDRAVARLRDIRADLGRIAAAGGPSEEEAATLAESVAGLQAEALPPPFGRMMAETATAATAEAADITAARIVETLRGAIASACRERIAARYPFARDGKREVALEDLAHVLGPKGLIDQFASENVLPAAETSGPDWKWREDSALARRLGKDALADFQRAAEIRDAFFATPETTAPGFAFSVTPPPLPGARLDIGAIAVVAKARKAASATGVQWPGPAEDRGVALSFHRPGRAEATIEKAGVWAIFRLIDAGGATGGETVTFSLGGRDLDYRFESRPASPGGRLKPLDLAQLRKFRCPGEAKSR
ncbi:type VI secretion system membrane subunit TssM [Methylocapsa acidiphila]|uniref:type VI secretion system membrane subunit TssM n=1 Tax=Methylocapsa acidiphila TaxID=133552 RepID=UPI000419B3FC|nr:type VI secretion system membrane subunit TssM [Methylocapsa acidiphila]